MKPILIHIARRTAMSLAIAVMAMSWACNDTHSVSEPDPRAITVGRVGSIAFESETFSRGDSRASGDTDEQSAEASIPQTIGVFAGMEDYDGAVFHDQIFYYLDSDAYLEAKADLEKSWDTKGYTWDNANKWPYAPLVYWTEGKKYHFYAYSPHSTYHNTKVTFSAPRYNGMLSMIIDNIPPFSAMNYAVAKNYVEHTSNNVHFTMQNLSARLCVRLKIGEEYAKLRQIKITEVSVKDRDTGATYFKSATTLSAEQSTTDISIGAPYSPDPNNNLIKLIPIFQSEDGLELRTGAYQQFGSLYVMPQTLTPITINVTYDVYDASGMLVRAQQKVSNIVSLIKDDNFITVQSGKYYNINILVSPKYLYVLSDNDVPPTLVMEPAAENGNS